MKHKAIGYLDRHGNLNDTVEKGAAKLGTCIFTGISSNASIDVNGSQNKLLPESMLEHRDSRRKQPDARHFARCARFRKYPTIK